MTKKRFSGALDVLGVVDPYGATGEQTGGEALVTLELDACRPDPDQPRHVLPGDLRERVLAGAPPAEVLWEAWERCLGTDLYSALRSHEISPAEALMKRREEGALDLALQLTLEGLVDLAGSIARHGLRHPLNVYDLSKGRYRLAEGERRWWAHVLLRDALLRVEASTVPAHVRLSPTGDALVRRQAEDAHRRDLPAIARARAVARLREAVAEELSGTTGSCEGGGADRGNAPGTIGSWDDAAARAPGENDLDDLTGRRLVEWTGKGVSGRMIRYYLALLSLPPAARDLAEAAALGERALRPIVSLDDPAEQARLVHALAAGEMTPAQVRREARRLGEKHVESHPARALVRLRAGLHYARDLHDPALMAARIARLPPKKRDELLDLACRYAAFLQAVLEAVEGRFGQDDL
jgi:hypothetical protein